MRLSYFMKFLLHGAMLCSIRHLHTKIVDDACKVVTLCYACMNIKLSLPAEVAFLS